MQLLVAITPISYFDTLIYIMETILQYKVNIN